jgi:hypothetical protein
LDITSDISLKRKKFEQVPLTQFWLSPLHEYPAVSKLAVLKLLPFPKHTRVKLDFQVMQPQKQNIATDCFI